MNTPFYIQVSTPFSFLTQVNTFFYTQVNTPFYTQVNTPLYTQVNLQRKVLHTQAPRSGEHYLLNSGEHFLLDSENPQRKLLHTLILKTKLRWTLPSTVR